MSPRERFFSAAAAGDAKTARKLLPQLPNAIKEMSDHEAALLTMAADEGRYAVVKLLLDLGFPIETRGSWGGTALHHAAWNGHPKIVRLLLQRGARTDLLQHFGGDALNTAIHGTVHGGRKHGPEIVKLIAAHMTSPDWERYLKHAKTEDATLVIPILEALIRSTRS
jgi:ankyrin repeat protein